MQRPSADSFALYTLLFRDTVSFVLYGVLEYQIKAESRVLLRFFHSLYLPVSTQDCPLVVRG